MRWFVLRVAKTTSFIGNIALLLDSQELCTMVGEIKYIDAIVKRGGVSLMSKCLEISGLSGYLFQKRRPKVTFLGAYQVRNIENYTKKSGRNPIHSTLKTLQYCRNPLDLRVVRTILTPPPPTPQAPPPPPLKPIPNCKLSRIPYALGYCKRKVCHSDKYRTTR